MRDLLACWSLLLLGCGQDPLRGLTLAAEDPLPPTRSGTAHLSRLLVRNGRVYGGNGSAGLMSWQVDGGRRLTPRSSTEPIGQGSPSTEPSTVPRCVAMAIAPDGRWLYCSAADSGVAVFDLSDPDHPVVVERGALTPQDDLGYADLRVVDGALLVAAFDRGLLRGPIGADGRPGPWQPTGIEGNVVAVGGGNGDALVALDRRRGLLHLASADGALRLRGILSLDGPPLGVTAHGTRAAVALGSSGVILVDLSADSPRIVRRVSPPCVATRADFTDTSLAVACSTGAWLYDLRGTEPRVADFDPAEYGVLDVAFSDEGRTLWVADWRTLLAFGVDPTGHAYLPDVSGGAYLQPGGTATVAARNPGDVSLTFAFSRVVEGDQGVEIEAIGEAVARPGEVVRFRVAGAQLAAWSDPRQRSTRFLVTSRESVAWQRPAQGIARFVVADHGLPGDRPPAEGETFPHWNARPGAPGPASLPPTGPSDLVLLLPDCALQWGAIEDLAWQRRNGRLLPNRQLVMLSLSFGRELDEPSRIQALRRLDAAELGGYALGDYLGDLTMGQSSGAFIDRAFSSRFIGGGDFTEVFSLDAAGVLQHTDRIYRGTWPLR